MKKKWLSALCSAGILVSSGLSASEEQPKTWLGWFAALGSNAAAGTYNYAAAVLQGGADYAADAAKAIGGAVATGATAAVNAAYSAKNAATQEIAAAGDRAIKGTIKTLAERYAAEGAGNIAEDLMKGQSSTDVLAGIGIGAAMYLTLMKAYGAVAKDMGTDLGALMKAVEKMKAAQGFEDRAPYTKVVVTNLWVVMDDILNMLAVLEKPLAQAAKLKLKGTTDALIPASYVDALRSVTVTYAAYLHAILEMVGNVVPDMFEYIGDLEQLADILTPKK